MIKKLTILVTLIFLTLSVFTKDSTNNDSIFPCAIRVKGRLGIALSNEQLIQQNVNTLRLNQCTYEYEIFKVYAKTLEDSISSFTTTISEVTNKVEQKFKGIIALKDKEIVSKENEKQEIKIGLTSIISRERQRTRIVGFTVGGVTFGLAILATTFIILKYK